tara:strand:- start:73 stop:522 length:450 start_codon:yes stop_codon:yes gene_type:complete
MVQLANSVSKCPNCNYTDWNNPTPVVACLVIHEEHAVLARNHNWPPGMFSVISGFLEYQEEPIECARRETLEELNLAATSIEWIDSMIFKELNQVILGYVVYGEGNIKCSEELIELKRIPLHKLKAWDFGTGYLVKRFLEQRGVEKPNR